MHRGAQTVQIIGLNRKCIQHEDEWKLYGEYATQFAILVPSHTAVLELFLEIFPYFPFLLETDFGTVQVILDAFWTI